MTLDTSKPVLQTVGNYDLLEKIAEGGMGAIYKGRHRETGQVVAIKTMPPHTAQNPVLVRRFEQEPWFRSAVAVRRWDDAAKVPGLSVPGLEHYRSLLEAVLRQREEG